jgi:hypothetical protein
MMNINIHGLQLLRMMEAVRPIKGDIRFSIMELLHRTELPPAEI